MTLDAITRRLEIKQALLRAGSQRGMTFKLAGTQCKLAYGTDNFVKYYVFLDRWDKVASIDEMALYVYRCQQTFYKGD